MRFFVVFSYLPQKHMNDPSRPTLLIVDDAPENLFVLSELLQPLYRVLAANNGERGLQIATAEPRPDLILLDVMMPGMNGYQVLQALQADALSANTPVIFLTALSSPREEERGLGMGAADYITKPITPATVLARVRTQLQAKQARDGLQDQNATLEAEVARRMAENDLTQQVSIRALAHLAEIRDPDTGKHLARTQGYMALLADLLKNHPRFQATLTPLCISLLARSAPMHDIGKVGIPDHILNKPGKLTAPEWAVMQTHAKLGSDAMELAEQDIERPLEFFTLAKEIAHWHHEKWDGSGYPDHLAGDAIPLSARLMAIADVFDALISVRVYKPAFPFGIARDIMAEQRGKHFDPDILDAFLANFEAFVAIAEQYCDDLVSA